MSQDSAILLKNRASARVTISDVADALNLTKSTVSRAMNGYSDISEATQLRVRRMAEQMNYQPLSQAQALKTGRTRSLGLVLQMSDHDAQRPFLAEFLAGLSTGATAHGYTLTVASAENDAHVMETFRALIRDQKADGFILPRVMLEDPRVELLRAADVPFVLYGRQDNTEGCSWFDVRGEDAMRDAVLHLADLGHHRIGFINGGSKYAYSRFRKEGYLRGMCEAGLNIDDSLCLEDAVTLNDGVVAAQRLLEHSAAPTALICAVDQVALGVYRAAAGRGLTVGQELSVVGYDGIQEGAHAQPQLTTFSIDNKAVGAELATLLIRRLNGEPCKTLRSTAPARFINRGSTGPALSG